MRVLLDININADENYMKKILEEVHEVGSKWGNGIATATCLDTTTAGQFYEEDEQNFDTTPQMFETFHNHIVLAVDHEKEVQEFDMIKIAQKMAESCDCERVF